MRRALLLTLLLAGCAAPEAQEAPPSANATFDAPSPDDGAAPPAPAVGERAPVAMERFVMLANGTLGVLSPGDPEAPAVKVAESLSPTSFYESFVTGLMLHAWPSFAFGSAWESTGDIDVTIRFTSDAAAAATIPKATGFPPVGAFLGTPERYAFFLLATDAPDTLEAGKEYEVTLHATPPRGGLFLRPGEQLALHPYLSYASADGRPASYVVGGPDPAGFTLPHQHFAVGALTPVLVLDEAGELPPNPTPSGDSHPAPVELSFQVPPEAVYIVMEVAGTPKAGDRVDVDLSARTPAGEVIMGGHGPHPDEMVVLGPGNLQAYGRDLVARVTCATSASGATFTLKVTAYVP